MSSQAAPHPIRALRASEAGFLALLLGANLAAFATDVTMCALYPSLAARFHAPVETVVLLTTPRALAQLGVLALGPLSDRLGRATILVGGLLLLAAGAWGGAVAPGLAAMAVVQVAFGLAIAAVAVVPAFVGDRYDYAVRGSAMAVVRLAVPLALIVVVPALVALAIGRGVAAPFLVLGAAAAALALLSCWRLPRTPRQAAAAGAQDGAGAGWARPRVLLLLLLTLSLALAPTSVFGFLPAWVTVAFGDPARTVGLALTGDGLGALAGITLGAIVVDRLTKRRAGVLSLAAAGGFALALAAAQRSLGLAVLAVAGFSGTLEIAFISLMALLSEAAPEARGTVMGLFAAALAIGAAIAPFLARILWRLGSMAAIGWGCGALLLALAAAFALVAIEPARRPA